MNTSYQKVLDILKQNKIAVKHPIMLTADQNDTHYTISVGWCGIGLKIAKTDINESEILALERDEETKGKVILNKIFEAHV